MDYTVIKFDIKAPSDVFESELNTIILALQEMRMMQELQQIQTVRDAEYFNKKIDLIKNSLDNMRIDRFE